MTRRGYELQERFRDVRLDAATDREPRWPKTRRAERSDRRCARCGVLGCADHVVEASEYASRVHAEAKRRGYLADSLSLRLADES